MNKQMTRISLTILAIFIAVFLLTPVRSQAQDAATVYTVHIPIVRVNMPTDEVGEPPIMGVTHEK